jgi:hypothetical protein
MRAFVLQCTSLTLAVACQSGEVVKARWTDGTWRKATIVDVRERPDGVCGQYRVVWHHNHICEDPTITGHDTRVSMNFCLVSRDAIQSCKHELCRWGPTVESEKSKSSGTGADEESNRHVAIIVVLVSLLLACCCVYRCVVQHDAGQYEVDEEKGMEAGTPCGTSRSLKSGRSFWNFTPKSVASSPTAKRISKARMAAGPSKKEKRIAAQPEPVAPVLAAKTENGNFQIVEQKRIKPEKGTGRLDPLCPPSRLQMHGSALRHAAQTYSQYGGRAVPPPQSICPPDQLPTLLNKHREGLAKPPPRRKPPLQGVPPQGAISESVKAGPTSYQKRSQAPYFV